MGVWVNVGARDERADEGGLSHFIEHMVFKGTPDHPNVWELLQEKGLTFGMDLTKYKLDEE